MEIAKSNKTALLFGASGLVGSKVLEFLLMHPAYSKVKIFVRRKLDVSHEKLEQHIINFSKIWSYQLLMKGDDLFLCLGTTMAKAKSKESFYRVDFTYNFKTAEVACEVGVNQIFLVSSVNASPTSRVFYLRVKGELEEAVKHLPFWSVHIFRPSLLLGERNENRWGEEAAAKIGRVLNKVLGGLLMKYKPVEADIVAKAMVQAAQKLQSGVHYYPSNYLQELAEENDRQLRNT